MMGASLLSAATLSAFALGQALAPAATPRSGEVALAAETFGCGITQRGTVAVSALGGLPVITLSANGQPVTLILDTGAERTVLTAAAVQRINAQSPRIEFQRQLRGIAGVLSTREVELQSFSVGAVAIPWRRAVVAPITLPNVLAAIDGLLGAETLSDFDIDLDMPHQRLGLYQKQSCSTAAAAWAGSHTGIATGQSRGRHLFFPLLLDDHRIIAFVDTGSQRTVLAARAAHALGLTDAVLARDRPITLQGAATGQLAGQLHRFSKLAIGAEVIRDPEVAVSDLHLADADMVIGMDLISSRRLWLSYGSLKIFLSSR
jgi:predicted aspartyl protease